MSSGYDTNPPSYTDPSAADDILSLIGTALAVQAGLFNASEGLKRVNGAAAKELLLRLADMDQRYLRLLNESRAAATDLHSDIQNFIDVAIPISQDITCPVEERVAIVKGFADKIATSAQQDLQPYDKQVEILKENLNQLVVDLTDIEAALMNQPNHTNNTDVVAPPLKILSRSLSQINKVQKRPPVTKSPSKAITAASAAVDEGVLRDISALVVLFSGLIGTLGHFGAVWDKLVSDSIELSVYLSNGTTDQDIFDNRVQAEVGVYEKIQQALDDYCLRTA